MDEKKSKAMALFDKPDTSNYREIKYNYFYLINSTLHSPAKNYPTWKNAKEKGVDIENSFHLALESSNARSGCERNFQFIGTHSEISYITLLSSTRELTKIEVSRLFGSVSKELFNTYKFKDLIAQTESGTKNRLFDLKIKIVTKDIEYVADM